MSLQKTFLWPHSKNPGETFEGWATESRQLSVSLRQMLARRIFAGDGGCSVPTPTAGDAKSSGSRNLPGSKANPGVSLSDYVRGSSSTPRRGGATGGKLNPRWVEWLMGWPIGWTDVQGCEHSETVRCLWPQRPHGTTSWSS